MTTLIVRFLSIVSAGLIAGVLMGIWLGFNPGMYSFSTYVEHQQGAIKALNTLMPILGAITILLTLISAFLHKADKTAFITLISAAILLIISGLVTKFGNQPINKIIMVWHNADAPTNWWELRDEWWMFHKIRSLTSITAFLLIAWTGMRKDLYHSTAGQEM